jgi:ankyrin repeat protein
MSRTPLHLAIRYGKNALIAKLMIEKGADSSRYDIGRHTPLHHFFNPSFRIIVNNPDVEVDTSSKDEKGMTILHYIACSSRSSREDLRIFLARKGATLLDRDDVGRSVLHFAAERGNLDLMEYLGEQDAYPELCAPDKLHRSPLYYAVESGRAIQAINFFVGRGLNIHHKDVLGRTALHHAALRGRLGAVKALLEKGAMCELSHRDSSGKTPLQLAKDWKASLVVEHLTLLDDISDKTSNCATSLSSWCSSVISRRSALDTISAFVEMLELHGFILAGVIACIL